MGADEHTAAWARDTAAPLFAPEEPVRPRGLVTRLFGRRSVPDHPDPDRPGPDDVEAVLAGRYVTPDRSAACWAVLEYLTAALAWGCWEIDLDRRGLEDFDFAVARAGGSADLGLGRLLRTDARIGLTRAPGLCVGYLPLGVVRHSGRLLGGIDLSDTAYADQARDLATFLDRLPDWAAEAQRVGRPGPDLVGYHRTDDAAFPRPDDKVG